MAKHTYEGLSKHSDEIPQPISIVLGGNLRKDSNPPPKPPKAEDKPDK
jgi:hypothetical protein